MKHLIGLVQALFMLVVVGCGKTEATDNRPSEVADQDAGDTYLQRIERAFAIAHDYYPFNERKGVHWDDLLNSRRASLEDAQSRNDILAIYEILREMIWTIPDGHVYLGTSLEDEVRMQKIAAGFGFSLIELDDRSVIAHVLLESGPAAQAGMRWGAEIIEWNGRPIQEAISVTPVTWAPRIPATAEGRRLERARLLTRAPLATRASVSFRNPNEEKIQTVDLSAVDDHMQALEQSMLNLILEPAGHREPIYHKVLQPSGYGYIRVTTEYLGNLDTTLARFQKEMDQIRLDLANTPGIIIDVRDNTGGHDQAPPLFANLFFSPADIEAGKDFYESVSRLKDGQWRVDEKENLVIAGSKNPLLQPLVVLIDENCISSGEGIPLTLGRLDRAEIMGFHGTHGSFAVDSRRLPIFENMVLYFPAARTLAKDGSMQVDSDLEGNGGVVPTFRIPRTGGLDGTIHQSYVERRDVLLEQAIAHLNTKR